MICAQIKATLPCDIQRVWEVVTSVEQYAWRSDLSRTEVRNEKEFVEYTKDDFATRFTVTAAEPYRRWEFELENRNLKGRWIGRFTPKGAETEVEFTEYVTVKKFFLRLFARFYLNRQQTRFLSDLKQTLLR